MHILSSVTWFVDIPALRPAQRNRDWHGSLTGRPTDRFRGIRRGPEAQDLDQVAVPDDICRSRPGHRSSTFVAGATGTNVTSPIDGIAQENREDCV